MKNRQFLIVLCVIICLMIVGITYADGDDHLPDGDITAGSNPQPTTIATKKSEPTAFTTETPAVTQRPEGPIVATQTPEPTAITHLPDAEPRPVTAEPTVEPTEMPTEQPATPQGAAAGEQSAQPNRFPVAAVIAIGVGAVAVIAAIVLLFVWKRK